VNHGTGILAKIILPSLSPVASTFLLHVTRQRALLALSVSLQHRRDRETWPKTIEELGLPATLTIDACSDQPLVFRTENGWLLVYGGILGLDCFPDQ
jgi:hypothetical protein